MNKITKEKRQQFILVVVLTLGVLVGLLTLAMQRPWQERPVYGTVRSPGSRCSVQCPQ